MLYADDADIGSMSAEGLAKMMTVIVTVFGAAGLTVSKQKTETMLRAPNQAPRIRWSSKQREKGIDGRYSF